MMKINRKLKIYLILGSSLVLSYLIVIINPQNVASVAQQFVLSSLGVMGGLIIGAVGVFLGSVSNLYMTFYLRGYSSNKGAEDLFVHVEGAVKEIKHNVYFVISSIMAIFLLLLIRGLDAPYIMWPISSPYFSKEIVRCLLMLWLTILVFISIIDTVSAMFRLHRMNQLIHRIERPKDQGKSNN